eukprot:15439330-Alexandrium_andersonii.AAC.1
MTISRAAVHIAIDACRVNESRAAEGAGQASRRGREANIGCRQWAKPPDRLGRSGRGGRAARGPPRAGRCT